MITIKVNKKNDIIESVTMNGHANYADYGKDIVCAAASSIITTTINGILKLDSEALEYTQGETLEISILKHNDTTNTLIKNMIDLLEELRIQYSKNIKII